MEAPSSKLLFASEELRRFCTTTMFLKQEQKLRYKLRNRNCYFLTVFVVEYFEAVTMLVGQKMTSDDVRVF